ncbi:hypothetical protein [Nocardia sp. NPDC049707]|uniref:hypothetical protein n=1 Tax=Nocardia sp. NPDC049707 TaxID=3154735 RepID=UPI0034160B5C
MGAAAARCSSAFPDPDGASAPDDAAGAGRVGELAEPSFAVEPPPGVAPDPGETFAPDEVDAGRVAAVAEPALCPAAPAEPAAEPGRTGALDPETEPGPDGAGNG